MDLPWYGSPPYNEEGSRPSGRGPSSLYMRRRGGRVRPREGSGCRTPASDSKLNQDFDTPLASTIQPHEVVDFCCVDRIDQVEPWGRRAIIYSSLILSRDERIHWMNANIEHGDLVDKSLASYVKSFI